MKEKRPKKMMNRRVFISLAAKTLATIKKMFRMNNLKKIMGCKSNLKVIINRLLDIINADLLFILNHEINNRKQDITGF